MSAKTGQGPKAIGPKATDWKAEEKTVEEASHAATKNRLSEEAPSHYEDVFSRLGMKLPSSERDSNANVLSPEARSLRELQVQDGDKGLEARAHYSVTVTELRALETEVLRDRSLAPITKDWMLGQIRERIVAERAQYQEKLAESPEAFMAAHVADLRKFHRQYSGGRIVQTEYVQQNKEKIRTALGGSRLCFISGETGTGKTEVARIAAREFSGKDALVIRGYAGIGSTEIYGHMALTDSSEKRMENARKEIEAAQQAYVERYPDAKGNENELREIARGVLQKGGVTTTEYILGAVYQGAKEGRVVIIDEANYIPPELLASLNDIMTKRADEPIHVQQDGVGPITVQEGFGIIFTGNVNPPTGPTAKRYLGRKEFDAAFVDRVPVVAYGALPQATQGIPSQHSPSDKQLFTVAVTTALLPAASGIGTIEKLENRYGTLFLPGGARGGLDALWRFSQFASITQRAFSGDIKDGDANAFNSGGSSAAYIPKVQLSNRGVMRVIEQWRDDGFKHELDYYLARDIFGRATDPKDKAYLYQQAQLFGFFKTEGWDQNPDYSPTRLNSFSVEIQKNDAPAREIIPARAVIASVFGDIPMRTVWPDGAETEVQQEQNSMAAFEGMRGGLDALRAEFEGEVGGIVSTQGL